jgi:hypothetical protein
MGYTRSRYISRLASLHNIVIPTLKLSLDHTVARLLPNCLSQCSEFGNLMYEIVCGHVVGPQNSPIMIPVYSPFPYSMFSCILSFIRYADLELKVLWRWYISMLTILTHERTFESHLLSCVDFGRDKTHTTSHKICVRNSHALEYSHLSSISRGIPLRSLLDASDAWDILFRQSPKLICRTLLSCASHLCGTSQFDCPYSEV